MSPDNFQVRWDGGLEFTADRAGFETRIDGDEGVAPSPVGLLVESVAACAAIDVVLILRKGRQNLTGLSVTARARRADTQPRYVKGLKFVFHLSGQVDEAKARRAVTLSFEKYCSVYHSLRQDMELEWTLALNGEPAGEPHRPSRSAAVRATRTGLEVPRPSPGTRARPASTPRSPRR